MTIRGVLLTLLVTAALTSSPVLLISQQEHNPLFTTQDLLKYLVDNPKALHITLPPLEIQELITMLKQAEVVSQKVSSFMTSPEKLNLFLSELAAVADQETASPADLLNLIQKGDRDLVVTVSHSRRLQEVTQTNGTSTNGTNSTNPANSQIFNDMTPYALSGLWVTLFLLVMLCIGVSCLLDLKTNDRFARQNLWVGRES